MKKLIPLLLVFVMLAALFTAAAADGETASPVTLNWISARRAIIQAGLTGSYYTVEDFDVDIWIPDFLIEQEEVPQGWIYDFETENNTASVKVRIVGFEGECTIDSLEEVVTSMGWVSDGGFWINGYSTLIFEKKDEDSVTVAIPYEEGYVLEFVFSPMSDPEVYSLASVIMSTIQPHQLEVMDVALMIDADLNSSWGPEKSVRLTEEDGVPGITVFLWEDGITSETIGSITNWDAVRENKINIYNMYVDILEEFNMSDDVLMTVKYISPDEDLSFLTISGGEIVYDIAQ